MNQEKILKALAAISGLLLIVSGIWVFNRPKASLLPVYGNAPEFTLTAQNGDSIDSSELKGKVWVTSFVFSTCKTSCPMLAAQMRRLYSAMPDGRQFALVSISVDPEQDSPDKLARYAKDLGVSDLRWLFLTGSKKYIREIAVEGFKVAAEPGSKNNEGDILHSSKLVLVDTQGRIRGYFDGTLSASADEIKRAAEQLMREGKRG